MIVVGLVAKPLLGSRRRIKNADRGALVMMTDPHGTAAEEFRRLRTNVQFVDVTTGGKHSFVVSSAVPAEGKTTTAVNLAIAMADSGAKVLPVDGDLRNPSVASAMGLEGEVVVEPKKGGYQQSAAGFIVKPVDIEDFIRLACGIGDYWTKIVRLPDHK